MRRITFILIVGMLLISWSSYAKTINVSEMDWLTLKTELVFSLEQSRILEGIISDLKLNLEKAEESQVISGNLISDLERRLIESETLLESLKGYTLTLLVRLGEFQTSLQSTRSILDDNEKKHTTAVLDLEATHKKKIFVRDTIILTLGACLIVSSLYFSFK